MFSRDVVVGVVPEIEMVPVLEEQIVVAPPPPIMRPPVAYPQPVAVAPRMVPQPMYAPQQPVYQPVGLNTTEPKRENGVFYPVPGNPNAMIMNLSVPIVDKPSDNCLNDRDFGYPLGECDCKMISKDEMSCDFIANC